MRLPRITVRNSDIFVEAAEGETILEAALRAGADFPFSCRSGTCGTCKSLLESGEVDSLPYSPYALGQDERAAGWILACRAIAKSDCVISHPALAHQGLVTSEATCTVTRVVRATRDITIVYLYPESGRPLDFRPGQFALLTFPGCLPRSYSMANRPGTSELIFHIRHVPGGVASRFVRYRLRVGDPVALEGPFGDAYLRIDHRGPILAVAGGSGLAPIQSIVFSALDEEPARRIALYFGVRDECDLYLEDELAALSDAHPNLSFHIVLSQPSAPTTRRTGFLAQAVAADIPDLSGWKAYLAGPPIMVETCRDALFAQGLAAADCHADPFYTQAEKEVRDS